MTPNPPPVVSIITPLYNKGLYVAETIASVLRQTFNAWEWLIVDNGSTDTGPEIVDQTADRRVRLLQYHQTRGPGGSRNAGLAEARGEWIFFLDADDLLEPDHVDALLRAGRATRSSVVASRWQTFDHATQKLTAWEWPQLESQAFQYSSIAYPPWPVGAVLLHRDVCPALVQWPVELDGYASEDTAFWFRVLQHAQPVVCREGGGFRYRIGLPQSRNDYAQLESWARALSAVFANNVNYLQSESRPFHWQHAQYIMRSYAALWERAVKADNHRVAKDTRILADEWAARALRSGGWRSPAVIARSLCGIEAFTRARQFANR